MMLKLLAASLGSLVFSFFLAVPFISLLFRLRWRDQEKLSVDLHGQPTIFNELHGSKVGTPTGGGILIIGSSALFTALVYTFTQFQLNWTAVILYLAMFGFGLLGLYDDLKKFFSQRGRGSLPCLSAKLKLAIQLGLGLIISYLLFTKLSLHSVWLPFFGDFDLGLGYLPFATIVIVFTSNAFNITDGLDGLATGLLMISLVAFWYLAGKSVFGGDVTLFIAVLMGSLAAFIYFNIYPARVFMGDAGALSLGAILAIIALITNQAFSLFIIGGVFVVEAFSTLIQWGSIVLKKKRVFLIAPLHHHFEALGWPETKVTMRFWLAQVFLVLLGIFVASLV